MGLYYLGYRSAMRLRKYADTGVCGLFNLSGRDAMKSLNKYGFVSGGYIVDKMDRVALTAINTEFPDTKNDLWFTSDCSVEFLKQLCNTDNIRYAVSLDRDSLYCIDAKVKLLQGDTEIAKGYFTFVHADKNFCKNT